MNKLKAQLIKNMQAELDKLKEDLLNISSQEILSRAYEYAMKTEIIYAAHDANLNNYQIEALLKHPSPLNDVYSKYRSTMKNRYRTSLQTVLLKKPILPMRSVTKNTATLFLLITD